MKLKWTMPSVPMDEAKRRALEFLAGQPRDKRGQRIPITAACVAEAIWPGNQMHTQGAGGAASRILKRLEQDGRAYWTSNDNGWGWVCNG
jgi:hypothetical protein